MAEQLQQQQQHRAQSSKNIRSAPASAHLSLSLLHTHSTAKVGCDSDTSGGDCDTTVMMGQFRGNNDVILL